MIYETPVLEHRDLEVLGEIDRLRIELRSYLREPRRWFGTLRRATFARAVQGSNSIEGYRASVEDVVAVIEDEEPFTADEETRHAIAGYRDALTYVLQLAGERPGEQVRVDESLLKALHFMMLKYDLGNHPGQWRPGAIWVEDHAGVSVYDAPDRDLVEPLVTELLDDVNSSEAVPIVRAAMAHLNLVLIHPFSDGNGRMARCLQTLALAADGIVAPVFSSIESYLGRYTQDYYRVLEDVAQGSWQPDRSARPWIEFCLAAHYRQATDMLRRIREMEALWDACEQLVARHRLPARGVGPLADASRGQRLHRSLYMKLVESSTGESITDASASRDLRALSQAGLLEPYGEKRGRWYGATQRLSGVWRSVRNEQPAAAYERPYASSP